MMNNVKRVTEKKNGETVSAVNYTHDFMGNVTKEVVDGVEKNYTYDKNGNRVSFTTDGINQTYVYDNLNRLTEVKENGNTIANYRYNKNGKITNVMFANGIETDYDYNKAGWLINIKTSNDSSVLSDISYLYSRDGNILTETDKLLEKKVTYTYDGLNRLKTETDEKNNRTYSYNYDIRGNRTSAVTTDSTGTYNHSYVYDLNNRLLQSTKTNESGTELELTEYTYDIRGNMTSKAISSGYEQPEYWEPWVTFSLSTSSKEIPNTFSYAYDDYNRLIHMQSAGQEASYTYDANGLRTSKTVNNITQNHVWDGMNMVKDGDTCYYYGLDLISSTAGDYYIHDGHGDVIALAKNEGTKTRDYKYDAFGTQYGSSNEDNNPFRFCGEYYDKESDLIYLRARYYDPSDGRFLTQDPAKDGSNWYIYCYNNPATLTDPMGTKPGDPYKTPEDAVKDFATNYFDATIMSRHEIGSVIYMWVNENGETVYSYTDYVVGSFHSVSLTDEINKLKQSNPNVNVEAVVHTHTKWNYNEYGNNGYIGQFSDADVNIVKKSKQDMYVVSRNPNTLDTVDIYKATSTSSDKNQTRFVRGIYYNLKIKRRPEYEQNRLVRDYFHKWSREHYMMGRGCPSCDAEVDRILAL